MSVESCRMDSNPSSRQINLAQIAHDLAALGAQSDLPAHIRTKIETIAGQLREAMADDLAEFASLSQSLRVGLLILNADTEIVLANPAAQHLLGLDYEAMLGARIFPRTRQFLDEDGVLIPSDGLPLLNRVRAGQTVNNLVLGIQRTAPADVLWLLVSAVPRLNPDGSIWQIICTFSDITTLKHSEHMLRESEQRYMTLLGEAQRQSQELNLLDKVRSALASELDLHIVVRKVVDVINETFGYTLVSHYLLRGDTLYLQHQVGYDNYLPEIPLDTGIIGKTVRLKHPIFLEDVRADPDYLPAIEGVVSEICVPLFDHQNQVFGVINVESANNIPLSQADFHMLLAVGEHVSIAIARARLYTELHSAQELLRVQNERYNRASQASAAGVWELHVASGELYLDPHIKSFLGYEDHEVENTLLAMRAYVHPDDWRPLSKALNDYLEGHTDFFECEYRAVHRDGSVMWLMSRGRGTRGQDGKVDHLLCTCIDITARKHMEHDLRESERQTQALLSATPDLMLRIDANGTILDYSPPKDWQIPVPPITAKQPIDTVFPPETAQQLMNAVRRTLQTQQMGQVEFITPEGDHEARIVAMNLLEALVIIRDISERKHAIQHQLEMQKIEVLRTFISHASHDLRTPITTLLTSIYLLDKLVAKLSESQQRIHAVSPVVTQEAQEMESLIEKIVERTGTLEETSLRLSKMVESMLEAVRIDNDVIFSYQVTELNNFTGEAAQKLQSLARQKNITLHFIPAAETVWVYIDHYEFDRLLKCLVENAVNYSTAGSAVFLRVYARPQHGVVEVEDSGIGIAEEDLPLIFERFYRVNKARTSDDGGMGLGLAIARKIVEAHDGQIEVESRIGLGSVFRVIIPLFNRS